MNECFPPKTLPRLRSRCSAHGVDDRTCVALVSFAALVQNRDDLIFRELIEVQLDEAVPDAREEEVPAVAARGVLRRKEREDRVRADGLLRIRDVQPADEVKQPVEHLEDLRRREVQLVEDDPVPVADDLEERALLEDRRSSARVRHNSAKAQFRYV